jgi:hypothetical protein
MKYTFSLGGSFLFLVGLELALEPSPGKLLGAANGALTLGEVVGALGAGGDLGARVN